MDVSTGRTPPAPAPGAPAPAARRPETAGPGGSAGRALAVFAVLRGAGALVVAVGAWWAGRDPVKVLGGSWDSFWYLSIAAHGYGRTQMWPASDSIQSDAAFFPLYPLLTHLLGGGPVAGLAVAWTAAGAAAVGVYRVGERMLGARAGVLLVALWASLPHAVVLTLGYTEPLLCALAAWALYALLRERWMWAASLAVLAGLTRPTGIAVAAAVTVPALRELLRGNRAPAVWAAALLAPAGWAAYVGAVGARRHEALGYFTVQRQWGSRFDFGAGTVGVVDRVLTGGNVTVPVAVTVAALAVALLLAVLLLLDRAPLPLLVYTGTLLVITVGGAGFFESKPRFLLPAFPLLLPLAAATARARPRTAVAVTAGLAGLSYGYGAYLLLMAEVPL
ncbi:hypothetical protein WDV06_27400 [Streptomyces racemochromogenes]|uniref:Glycosyltransferase RgtA/B/C/D-like domain-containing protein n=1 Tax=Streptomyces racemochromogenes TaxID=67353 RepID=A0ABW7PK50_9ACTN